MRRKFKKLVVAPLTYSDILFCMKKKRNMLKGKSITDAKKFLKNVFFYKVLSYK